MENLTISNETNCKASLCFKCIICSNFQDIPYLSNTITPICNECLFDLKCYVETRRPKT